MSDPLSSPTATGVERALMSTFGVVGLVLFPVGGLRLAALALLPLVVTLVLQQRRENRDRRAALAYLKAELPSMSSDQRANSA